MTDAEKQALKELTCAVAQLRHAYSQLIDYKVTPWDNAQRGGFADGLIAPQIRRLEHVLAIVVAGQEGRVSELP